MIDRKQARELALKNMEGMKINSVLQVESGWVFSFVDATTGCAPDISTLLVDREGNASVYFPPDHIFEYQKAVKKV